MTTATDRHGLEVLPLAQCLALLRSRPLGRLAYVTAGTPTVVPVNHLVDGSAVVIRSFAGAKLHAALVEAQSRSNSMTTTRRAVPAGACS